VTIANFVSNVIFRKIAVNVPTAFGVGAALVAKNVGSVKTAKTA
jgi:hypothetical protein